MADNLDGLRDLENREWMVQCTALFRERDRAIEGLKRNPYTGGSSANALTLNARPVRLEALTAAVDSRIRLRAEYSKRNVALVSEDALSQLHAELEAFVNNYVKDDPRALADAGDIIAAMRVALDKLGLDRPSPATTPASRDPHGTFISYSWDDDNHKAWVAAFVHRLRSDGVDVILDETHLPLGASSTHFMETSIRQSCHVLVICTPGYKCRFDNRTGGAGYEGHIITGEIVAELGKNKFIPVLRAGDWGSSIPSALRGIRGTDLRTYSDEAYRTLVGHLLGHSSVSPVGSPPEWLNEGTPPGTSTDWNQWFDNLTDLVQIPEHELTLHHESRKGSLAVWIRNETLDPIPDCRLILEGMQEFSKLHKDFRRNPFTPLCLISHKTLNAGTNSGGAYLLRCDNTNKQSVVIGDTRQRYTGAAIWRAVLAIEGDGRRRQDYLFIKWTPGEFPEFITDPRSNPA